MPTRRALLATFALLVFLPVAAASAAHPIVGKWAMGEGETALTVEFTSGGICFFRDIVAQYQVRGDKLVFDDWAGETKTMKYRISGDTLYLTDDSDETQKFTRVRTR